jgi:hypothetical protein
MVLQKQDTFPVRGRSGQKFGGFPVTLFAAFRSASSHDYSTTVWLYLSLFERDSGSDLLVRRVS